MGEQPPFVQHQKVVVVGYFVDEMRRPQNADAVLGDEPADMRQDVGPGIDIEADRGFVEQQQSRPMQQRAGDLQPAHLASGEAPRLLPCPFGQRDAVQNLGRTHARLRAAYAMQRRMIGEVLHHGQIEIERTGLKDDAEPAQRFARRSPDIIAEDTNSPLPGGIEVGYQRKQRALAGAVQSQKNREGRGLDGKRQVRERAPPAIRMADPLDRKGRRAGGSQRLGLDLN